MEDSNMKDLDTLINEARDASRASVSQKPLSSEIAVKAPPKPTVEKIRTFEHDAKTAIENNNGSLAKMKIAEEKKQRISSAPQSGVPIFWIILLVLLFIGSGVSTYVFFTKEEVKEVITEPVIEVPQTIIEYETNMVSNTDNLLSDLSKNTTGIVYVEVKDAEGEKISFTELAESLELNIPDQYSRNVTDYMLGKSDGNVFLIIKSPYNYALSGMLEWEGDLARDFMKLTNISSSGEFEDYFDSKVNILRGDGGVFYSVIESGYAVISPDLDLSKNIAKILL